MESKIFAKLNFDPGILVILSMILTVILLIVVISLLLRQSRLEMNYRIFMRGKNGKSLEYAFQQRFEEMSVFKEQLDTLHKHIMHIDRGTNKSFQKYGVVRYDAFRELGGNLSFSMAMLNDSDSGFVINCIHSREGSYTYIKDIKNGECQLPLSEEEAEAVQIAINSLNPTENANKEVKVKKSRRIHLRNRKENAAPENNRGTGKAPDESSVS